MLSMRPQGLEKLQLAAAADDGGKPEPILEVQTPQECIPLCDAAPDWPA